jgi:iron-sulfur cluster assembly protein
MALDEPKETDNTFTVNGFQFILDKDFYEKVKPVKVDFMGYGFKISSNMEFGAGAASGCGSCGGGSCETSSHSH